MAVFKAHKVKKNLLKKGFKLNESHHHFFEFWHNNKMISSTFTSHNSEDIEDYHIRAMSKQCKMDKSFFKEFIQCTKSKDDYIEVLTQNGEIKKLVKVISDK